MKPSNNALVDTSTMGEKQHYNHFTHDAHTSRWKGGEEKVDTESTVAMLKKLLHIDISVFELDLCESKERKEIKVVKDV